MSESPGGAAAWGPAWLQWRELPLALVGSMVVVGLVLEPTLYGVSLWMSKVPLAGLLGWFWIVRRWAAGRP